MFDYCIMQNMTKFVLLIIQYYEQPDREINTKDKRNKLFV